MNPKSIKSIDRYIGIPVCFFLTAYDKIRSYFFKKAHIEDLRPRKILFLKLIEQGASVLAYPAFKKAGELVGKFNLYVCVFEENRPIIDILGVIPAENIFTIRRDNIFGFACDLLSFLSKARRIGIDTAVDMEFFSRASAIMAYFTGARRRVGYHSYNSELSYRGDLMTHKVQYNPYIHVAHAYLLLVESLLIDARETPMPKMLYRGMLLPEPEFEPSIQEKELIENFFTWRKGRPRILVNPNASDMLPLRKWGAEKYIGLITKILSTYENAVVVITGVPSETPAAESICREVSSDRIINLAGKTSLRELMALYCAADVLITNDSGPGHFAAMTPVRTIVLFGPETPDLFAPISRNVQIIRVPLACSPCVNVFNHRFSPCKQNRCMEMISIDAVFEKIKEVITIPPKTNSCNG